MDKFSDRIQLLIDRHGRKALSEATGISTTQLHRLKTGGQDTTRENLIRLCDATGTEFLWLGKGEGPMYSDGTPAPAMPADPVPEFSKDELEMLNLFRNASLMQKMQVVQMLSGVAQESSGVTVSGDGNTTAGRDLNQG